DFPLLSATRGPAAAPAGPDGPDGPPGPWGPSCPAGPCAPASPWKRLAGIGCSFLLQVSRAARTPEGFLQSVAASAAQCAPAASTVTSNVPAPVRNICRIRSLFIFLFLLGPGVFARGLSGRKQGCCRAQAPASGSDPLEKSRSARGDPSAPSGTSVRRTR